MLQKYVSAYKREYHHNIIIQTVTVDDSPGEEGVLVDFRITSEVSKHLICRLFVNGVN